MDKPSSPRVFVIVVTYNGIKWIDSCLSSLRYSSVTVNPVVVDNASRDNTVSFIKDNYEEVKLFVSKVNLGFGQANNIGIKYAMDNHADYVYLLNQDAWIFPNTIQLLIDCIKPDSNLGIISPIQIESSMQKVDKLFMGDILDNKDVANSIFNDLLTGKMKGSYSISFFPAAHWLITRNCIEKVGLFSPIFYHYGEDNNYIHRTHYFGFKTDICVASIAVHDRGNRKKLGFIDKLFFRYIQSLGSVSNVNLSGFLHNMAFIKYIGWSSLYIIVIKIKCLFDNSASEHLKKTPSLKRVIKYYYLTKQDGFLLKDF